VCSLALLNEAGVPRSPILDIAQVMDHPHTLARELRLQPQHADTPPMVAQPMLMDGHRMTGDLAPPALNAHEGRWQPRDH
jgi:crotonobetainyl-CoA:carnitine CoA-transferase CaiB-like acyl-CoA transferase